MHGRKLVTIEVNKEKINCHFTFNRVQTDI